MNKQLIDLAFRRRLLLEKINTQRMEVIEISSQFKKPLALLDTGIKAVHFIQSHTTLMTSGVALLLALRRGKLRHMAQEGWRLFCLYTTSALTRSK